MKTEVYSWRVSSELKQHLEREARRRKASVASILDAAAREWLAKSRASIAEDEEQKRLHAAIEPLLGSISRDIPYSPEILRETIRRRVNKRYGR
jgi:transcription elongation GreA/GreB family factor